jgi:hypothetical protein
MLTSQRLSLALVVTHSVMRKRSKERTRLKWRLEPFAERWLPYVQY